MKILVLSAKTGGGHEMRAQAIQDFCKSLNIRCAVYRPLEEGSSIYSWGTGLYNLIQRICPRLHYIYFNFLEHASLHRDTRMIIGAKKFKNVLSDFEPDVVFSVHAHLNHAYFELFESFCTAQGKRGKFVVFCGELDDGVGFSRHWINPRIDFLWAPTRNACLAAIRRGMPKDKCKAVGPLMRKPFYQISSKRQRSSFCSKYGIDMSLPVGTLATGANGVNSHRTALDGLIAANNQDQIVALCGESSDLMHSLNDMNQIAKFKILPLPTLSSQEMSILLDLTSWVFGRPGAGLTTEVLAKQKRMYFDISGGIMPQEQNNLNYWLNFGEKPTLIKRGSTLGKYVLELPKSQKVFLSIDETRISQHIRKLFTN